MRLRPPHAARRCSSYARDAAGRGLRVIIAGAGGAAHLPGMVASATPLPVIGVPVPLKYLDGMDSLLSIVQMPAGVPVATVSIGGARNAGLLAVRILAAADPACAAGWTRFRRICATHGRGEGRRAYATVSDAGRRDGRALASSATKSRPRRSRRPRVAAPHRSAGPV